jgi:hypothetical protein
MGRMGELHATVEAMLAGEERADADTLALAARLGHAGAAAWLAERERGEAC